MIKINRDLESEKVIKAKEILSSEKCKKSGTYNKPEVLDALKLVFNNKCYICENKKITSYNIEHLKPHKKVNIDLKFDWENLFLVCAHCNNIKLEYFENILDCTKVDVDEMISFRKLGNFAWEEQIEILALKDSDEIKSTVNLLNKVYDGTTAMKKMESVNLRSELRNELNDFTNAINEYIDTDGADKEDAEALITRHIKSNSPFAAFKRWIIRDNKEHLSKFLHEGKIKCTI